MIIWLGVWRREWMRRGFWCWTIQNSRLNTQCKSIAVAVHFSLAMSWFEVSWAVSITVPSILAPTYRQQQDNTELWTMIIRAALFPFSHFWCFLRCMKHEGERLFSGRTVQVLVLQTRMETRDRTRLVALWTGRKHYELALAKEITLSWALRDKIMANVKVWRNYLLDWHHHWPSANVQSLLKQTQTKNIDWQTCVQEEVVT